MLAVTIQLGIKRCKGHLGNLHGSKAGNSDIFVIAADFNQMVETPLPDD